ncbi:cytochrome-c oxidase, cbb3-type subunit III [Hahella sp. KA22]|uniref:cytochrome-c oxidase, cbb3-type subunit III n=1 Tax=Hahella sp. KA22 TaxID=1628392 RepID=UPI000FDE5817|nr:cytochrome-c oxidase, cbb3-type subunit III [Hahella sp. KA22]AZZ91577.1 cytochrome-c oxidase, cbb3-type subunit III [Hahella sp. KA22]QAY54947.1 cytochrome-c oxidase, cbb3-type subunit III [Hahella sp. KA22]
MTSFWTGWISFIVLGSIFGCAWLLWVTRKSQKFDTETEQTMGHSFDGIEEYDNPLPRWWLVLFMGTIVFGLGYLVFYPGLGSYKGIFGWTSVNQWEAEVKKAEETYAPIFAKLAATPIEELAKDDKAMKIGQRLFANNCAVCHGSTAHGATGFPNLTDNDWLYGGAPEKIKETITDGRNGSAMRAWKDEIGEEGVKQVANYVRSLSNQEDVDEAMAAKGAEIFAANCFVCHGKDGKGSHDMGAPNLTDGIWLYGGTQAIVEATVRNGRGGVMPSFKDKLGEERIHLLAAYIYSLSHR